MVFRLVYKIITEVARFLASDRAVHTPSVKEYVKSNQVRDIKERRIN